MLLRPRPLRLLRSSSAFAPPVHRDGMIQLVCERAYARPVISSSCSSWPFLFSLLANGIIPERELF